FSWSNFLQPGPQDQVLDECAGSTYTDRHSVASVTYARNRVSQSGVGDLPQERRGIPALAVESTAAQELQSMPEPDNKDGSLPASSGRGAGDATSPPETPPLRKTQRDHGEPPTVPKTLVELDIKDDSLPASPNWNAGDTMRPPQISPLP